MLLLVVSDSINTWLASIYAPAITGQREALINKGEESFPTIRVSDLTTLDPALRKNQIIQEDIQYIFEQWRV
jgi:hypothetical protein